MATEQYPKVYLYRRIVQAKIYMDTHYADNIDLDNISDEALFSKFHFIRLFKKVYGKTPHQYLTSVRIENAVKLLKAGSAVSDVCYAVGLESLSSFGSLFKRIVRISPSAFREQHQVMKEQISKAPLKFVPGCFVHQNGWDEK
jgi:AraC-like DNA-binding protein